MVIIISIFIIFLYLLEIFSKRKVGKILSILLLLYLIILMGANTKNPDTYIYEEYIFNNDDFFDKDVGFGLLVCFFKSIGLNYYALKMFVSIFGILLIHSTVKKYIDDEKMFYLLYFIGPFFWDIVQVRNFLAMSIFIYSTRWLISDNNIKYCIVVLIAALFQKTALIYLPLCFLKNLDNKKILKFIMILSIGVSIFIGLNNSLLNQLMIFLSTYLSKYLSGLESKLLDVVTNKGWIVYWAIQFFNYFVVYLIKGFISRIDNKENIKNYDIKNKYIKIINNINIYAFLFLPLYIITTTFGRIIRNIYILNFIAVIIAIEIASKEIDKNKKRNVFIMFTFFVIFYLIIFLYQFLRVGTEGTTFLETIILPVYTENWILK